MNISIINLIRIMNDFRIPTEEELEKNNEALKILLELQKTMDDTHFKPVFTKKQLDIRKTRIDMMLKTKINYDKLKLFKPNKRPLKKKNEYNRDINSLISILNVNSPLQNLLMMDKNLNYQTKREPKQKKREDFIAKASGEENYIIEEAPFILHTKSSSKQGSRKTEYNTPEECLNHILSCLENSISWEKDVIVNVGKIFKDYGMFRYSNMTVKLKIPISGFEDTHWIESDCSKLRHILCGGCPPIKLIGRNQQISSFSKDFTRLFPIYDKFLLSLKQQLIKIIDTHSQNSNCPLSVVSCIRLQPPCNKKNICLKVSHGGSTSIKCSDCQMEYCSHGCGRIDHDGPCEISTDEASEKLISETTLPCPECRAPVFKIEGCNHMTCANGSCSHQFCYVCGKSIQRDKHGHQSTSLHFAPSSFSDIGIPGGCNQFGNVPTRRQELLERVRREINWADDSSEDDSPSDWADDIFL